MNEEIKKRFDALCKKETFTFKDVDNIVLPNEKPKTYLEIQSAYFVAHGLTKRAIEEKRIAWDESKLLFVSLSSGPK